MVASTPVSDPGGSGAAAPARAHNLALRIVSAAILAPLAIGAAYAGSWPFALFWIMAAAAVLWEWIALVAGARYRLMFSSGLIALAICALVVDRGRPLTALMVLGLGALAAAIFAPRSRRLWVIGGIFYAGVLLLAPLLLRHRQADGFLAILFLFAVVWTTDVLGYFGGRLFGGPKLLPAVSPNKTWSGAVIGTLGAMAVVAAGAHAAGDYSVAAITIVAFVLSIAAQIGDLMESRIKRVFGAKDASQLIPGHGGVMDRLDGFWAAALIGFLIGFSRGGFADAARGLLAW